MRFELFAKDNAGLVASARQLVNFGARGFNIPHKTKEATPLGMLSALQSALPPDVLRECVPHYSLKYAYNGGSDGAFKGFSEFCEAASVLPTPPRQLLLVSGSGKRQFDSVQCLRALPSSLPIEIGVAFNPYIPDRAERERERARLRLKLGTGRVSAIWLRK